MQAGTSCLRFSTEHKAETATKDMDAQQAFQRLFAIDNMLAGPVYSG
jgi:hypothetical protein